MAASASIVERLARSEHPVYGVSTGFGALATTIIPAGRRQEMQRALVRSHAAGMGDPVEREVVRAMLFLRARTLALGRSGARPLVAETILALLNADLVPVVPEHGALDVAAAMSVEAVLGTDRAFADDLLALRPQPGQQASGANLRRLLEASPIMATHREDDPRVQDAYSLRCAPQVHGAARDALTYAETVAEHELASAIDNPMVLPDGRVESCGNFHGAPLGYACDLLATAVADVG